MAHIGQETRLCLVGYFGDLHLITQLPVGVEQLEFGCFQFRYGISQLCGTLADQLFEVTAVLTEFTFEGLALGKVARHGQAAFFAVDGNHMRREQNRDQTPVASNKISLHVPDFALTLDGVKQRVPGVQVVPDGEIF